MARASSADASVTTFFGEVVGPQDSRTGSRGAFAATNGAHSGASASGTASVTTDRDFSADRNAPHLHAAARGTSAGENHIAGGNANSSADWSDDLRYDNAQIIEPSFFGLGVYIWFVHHVEGTISGPGYGSFSLFIYRVDRDGNLVEERAGKQYTASVAETVKIRMPANALIYDNDAQGHPNYAHYNMELFAQGGSEYTNNGTWRGDGAVDFGGTLKLDTIYFGDADGNPIHDYDNIHVVGDHGQYVMGPPAAGAPVSWTFVYDQITSFTTAIDTGGEAAPILSNNGQRIAFARAYYLNNDNLEHILAISFDGSGQTDVDSYPNYCFCVPALRMSADGSKIVSSDSVQVRIANGNGSGATPLIALNNNQINAIAISGDGSKVFFRIYHDDTIRGTNTPIERGIWVIDANGSNLRQVVSPAQMVSLGIPATDFFDSLAGTLDVSGDGGRIVFAAFNGSGQGLFAVNLDGNGLHDLLGQVGYVYHGGISSDGTKVFYNITSSDQSYRQIGALNFDGAGKLPLVDSRTDGNLLFPDSSDRMQISNDGSRLLLGGANRAALVRTDKTGLVQLAITTPPQGDLQGLLSGTLYQVTMNGDATRYAYVAFPPNQTNQLATMRANPDSPGVAPTITNPTVSPSQILTNGRSTVSLSASVTAPDPLLTVGDTVLYSGEDDGNVAHNVMSNAGGNVYSTSISTNCCAIVGPHTLRIQAGTRSADNRLHATAVEFSALVVSDTFSAELTHLNSVSRPSNGHFVFAGLTLPNQTLATQAAPDLLMGFAQVGTTTSNANGAFQFDDAGAVGMTKRFYRLASP
jgi:Tol biopolymer transport system component